MIEKILVAVNSYSDNLLDFDSVIFLAKSTDATLMLLHVLSETDPDYPEFPSHVYYQVLKNPDCHEYQSTLLQYEQQTLDTLQNLTEMAIAAGVKAEYAQLNGLPGPVICEVADNWSANLIIVGKRKLKGLHKMFLGSVSNYVTHHAPCSVLIMHASNSAIDVY